LLKKKKKKKKQRVLVAEANRRLNKNLRLLQRLRQICYPQRNFWNGRPSLRITTKKEGL
jgi:hypothetical protein